MRTGGSVNKRRVVTSYPVVEDWGWFIEYLRDDLELMLGISRNAKDPSATAQSLPSRSTFREC